MKRLTPVLVALVVIGAGVFAFRSQRAAHEWEGRAGAALVEAAEARAAAAELEARATGLELEADSLAALLEESGRRVRAGVVEARAVEEAPDTCAPFLAWRDRAIDELTREADGWALIALQRENAADLLRSAYDHMRVSNDSLVAVLEARPEPRSRWMPQVGVGPYLGIGFDGRPQAGVGVTLSWEVR